MRAVLLARPDRDEEAWLVLEGKPDLIGNERSQVARRAHVIAGVVAVIAGAEWLYGSGAVAAWAWICGAAGAGAFLLALRRPLVPDRLVSGVAALTLGVALVSAAVQIRRIECCWPNVREARVTRASRALNAALNDAVHQAEDLATRAATAAEQPRAAAFAELARLMPREVKMQRGVVLYDADGRPWAWAGRHRRLPPPSGPELSATITPFYATLEARRQSPVGGMAVATVLLAAAPAATDTAGAMATAFARAHGVALRFWSPDSAPSEADLFDYTSATGDTVLSVEPVPPAQGDAKLDALARAALYGVATLVLAIIGLLLAAPPGWGRGVVVMAGAWAALRAGPELIPLFSPATYYRGALGVFGQSAGALCVAGFVALVGAALLWRRGLPRRWWTVGLAAVLVLVTPYLLRYLGRGISPPATGVGFALWVSWQAAIALTAAALVLTAAALVRGRVEPARVPWTVPAACGWAVLAGLAGLWLWRPHEAWPEWYTFAWLPALIGVMVPAPRRWAAAGVAVVAGTAAALLTWGATLEGRLALAARDAGGLGGQGDAMAVALLEKLGQQASDRSPPRSASALYALWLGSPLAARDYPALLALWAPDGARVAELRLAALDLTPPLLAALARSNPQVAGIRVERLARTPGVHWVLVAPFATGEVLTVGVGPRTALVRPERLARFLRGDARAEAPYDISLSLPHPESPALNRSRFWERTGWTARGERLAALPDGPHHVHVRVSLGSPAGLVVRGILVVFVDLVLAGLAWFVGLVVAEGWRPRLPDAAAAWRGSYRARLTAALIAFVMVPMLLFAGWSIARLRDEARRAGDLLIGQTLRDAAVTAGPITGVEPDVLSRAVTDLGQRLDADLWLYSDGVLAGTSPTVLGDLALVDPLLDPVVYRRLTMEDELDLTTDGRTAGRPIRVGYRVVSAGPMARNVLAAPQLLDDERVRGQEEDLALVLMAATLAGLAAAVYLAGLVARTLARPVGALRDAATAIGRGAAPPPFPERAPPEFAPVFTAFDRMAHDVRRSQAALEEARERTARVLANVATGVIAVDDALRVTLANARAAELLGAALEPGDELPLVAGREWTPVWNALRDVIARAPGDIAAKEFEVDGRQIRAQFASLGPRPDGCVVALDDTTAIAHAARVLAWGEMARQVAHEIKNPLTPIRLGIQHLQRAKRGRGQAQFEAMLDETAQRILVEIDRLDAIARAFSRFGAPADPQPLEGVDLLATAREVAHLYSLGGTDGARVTIEGEGGALVEARRDEVKEVLVNLVENARNAGAKHVVLGLAQEGSQVTVRDDGPGIPADVLARLFEPRFRTTSSGAGLGLAIARRLVESWGGSIVVESEQGRGTSVIVSFRQANPEKTSR